MNSKVGIKMETVKKTDPKMRSILLKNVTLECCANKIGENDFIVIFLNSSFFTFFIDYYFFFQKISLKLQDTRVEFIHISNGNVACRTVVKMILIRISCVIFG